MLFDDALNPKIEKEIIEEGGQFILTEHLIAGVGKLSIHVVPEEGRNIGGNPKTSMAYFKVLTGSGYTDADKELRISFYRAEYIDHNKKSGIVRLSSKERKSLVKLLKSAAPTKTINKYDVRENIITVWELLIYAYDIIVLGASKDMILSTTVNDNKYNIVPIDLPMPDYLKLEVK